jgi:hypothetical protein
VWRRRDPENPADEPGAFLDAQQAETTARRRTVLIESPAAVDNRQLDGIRCLRQRHADISDPGVIGDVSQSFLHDAIQAHGDLARKRRLLSIRTEADVEPILPREIGTVRTQRLDEPNVFERRGM